MTIFHLESESVCIKALMRLKVFEKNTDKITLVILTYQTNYLGFFYGY